jgi:hypothetical protein
MAIVACVSTNNPDHAGVIRAVFLVSVYMVFYVCYLYVALASHRQQATVAVAIAPPIPLFLYLSQLQHHRSCEDTRKLPLPRWDSYSFHLFFCFCTLPFLPLFSLIGTVDILSFVRRREGTGEKDRNQTSAKFAW